MTELFIGIESTNIDLFVSDCCDVALSIEPLCRVVCGNCGEECKPVEIKNECKFCSHLAFCVCE